MARVYVYAGISGQVDQAETLEILFFYSSMLRMATGNDLHQLRFFF